MPFLGCSFSYFLIGYLLVYISESNRAWVVLLVLSVMVFASSWIALREVKNKNQMLYKTSLCSITVGGGLTLLLITQIVIDLHPWYLPPYMIPLTGMIFANAMNSVSLAAERLEAEIARDVHYEEARGITLKDSLIPISNSLFAVGLVSPPGMTTEQILSGISPLIAVRYQIMVRIHGSEIQTHKTSYAYDMCIFNCQGFRTEYTAYFFAKLFRNDKACHNILFLITKYSSFP